MFYQDEIHTELSESDLGIYLDIMDDLTGLVEQLAHELSFFKNYGYNNLSDKAYSFMCATLEQEINTVIKNFLDKGKGCVAETVG